MPIFLPSRRADLKLAENAAMTRLDEANRKGDLDLIREATREWGAAQTASQKSS
jgi:hypothetical protein